MDPGRASVLLPTWPASQGRPDRKKTIGSVQVVNRRAPNLKADGLLAKVYVFVLPPTTCHYLPRQDFGLGYADEILVTRQFLDEKQVQLAGLAPHSPTS